MRLVTCLAVMMIACSACAPQQAAVQAQAPAKAVVDMTAPGTLVRVKSRSGTFKPDETGHAREVNASAGKTGAIVRVLGESARVRFDAQTWDEFPPSGATVDLPAFEATLHISYLEPVR